MRLLKLTPYGIIWRDKFYPLDELKRSVV